MIKGVLIKKSLSVDEIVRNLKSRGVLCNIEVIDLSSATAQKCKEIGADVIFIEEESGVRVWLKLQVGSVGRSSGSFLSIWATGKSRRSFMRAIAKSVSSSFRRIYTERISLLKNSTPQFCKK